MLISTGKVSMCVCVGGRGMRGAGEGKHKEVGVMRVTLKMEWAGQAWL